eukprot:g3357.t1
MQFQGSFQEPLLNDSNFSTPLPLYRNTASDASVSDVDAAPADPVTLEQRRRRRQWNLSRFSAHGALVFPSLVLIIFGLLFLHGIICIIPFFVNSESVFNHNYNGTCSIHLEVHVAEVLVGLFGPFVSLFCCVTFSAPSRKAQMGLSFFGDALLDQMLSGDAIEEHYDISGMNKPGTIVFVGGLGCPRVVNRLHTDVLSRNHRCISVDLPGHGSLAAVPYSLARAVRVLYRVVEREAAGEPVILVGYGGGSYVAMRTAALHPDIFCGLIVAGRLHDYEHMGNCSKCCYLNHGCYELFNMRWVADVQNWRWHTRVDRHKDVPENVKNALAEESFQFSVAPDFVRELWRRSIIRPLAKFSGPILAVSANLSSLAAFKRRVPKAQTRKLRRIHPDIMPLGNIKKFNAIIEQFTRSLPGHFGGMRVGGSSSSTTEFQFPSSSGGISMKGISNFSYKDNSNK